MTEVVASHVVTTGLPPCCLRIFRDEFIIVGTYELDKPTGNRTGSIEIYNNGLKLLSTTKTYGAILDIKLSPFDDTVLVSVHSTGNLMLWTLALDEAKDPSLKLINNLQVFETDCLITSVQFSPHNSSIVLVTSTNGELSTLDLLCGSTLFSSSAITESLKSLKVDNYSVQGQPVTAIPVSEAKMLNSFDFQHSLECWTSEFGYLQPLQDVVFTGGDDSTIAAHDLRSGSMIWSNSRIHDAGVVSIQCSRDSFRRNKPTSLITGSYDDHIRSFDLRMLTDTSIYPGSNLPVVNKWEADLGGGVWRFASDPHASSNDTDRLLVCCMYNGAKIVNVGDEHFVTESFIKQGHDSMCYGGDWSSSLIATCSFYDKSLLLWSV